MKQEKDNKKKLFLNKETITLLTKIQQTKILGGNTQGSQVQSGLKTGAGTK
jgi:hypothetical protein